MVRFYDEKFPEVDQLVMVQVKQIQEMGAYVKLLEYDNIEGMILLSELSRRRIRSIQKLIRVGRNEVVVVMRVDKEKGYIDLSKRRVSSEDITKCEERYNKSKAVHSIMRHVAEKTGTDLEELNEKITWPLYRKYGHAYEAFKLSITEGDAVYADAGIELAPEISQELHANISRRLTPQPVKVRSDIEVSCFSFSGIDAIRSALLAGESLSTDSIPIKIKLVAPPLYVIVSNATDKTGALETLERCIERIEESIKGAGGELNVKMKPKVVSESDDAELQALMDKVANENREVSGDEESDVEGM
ncbi:translation initiation factor eIF-2 alpha subunit [Atractiella rhizophila]|nr:translation initiation factor eIF-2 alpha subunit [Atractiella rhizophila]